MSLRAARRAADSAAMRMRAATAAYEHSATQLKRRLQGDWKWPLLGGFGAGAIAGLLPVTTTLRIGNGVLRAIALLSQVPLGAMTRMLARRANGIDRSSLGSS